MYHYRVCQIKCQRGGCQTLPRQATLKLLIGNVTITTGCHYCNACSLDDSYSMQFIGFAIDDTTTSSSQLLNTYSSNECSKTVGKRETAETPQHAQTYSSAFRGQFLAIFEMARRSRSQLHPNIKRYNRCL